MEEINKLKSLKLSPLFVIIITLFIDAVGFGIIIPLLPFYAITFKTGPAALGFLIASFPLMQFFFSPILGRLSDKVGRKPILILSVLTSLASFILFAIADSFIILLLSRMVAGLATETAVGQAYIADITNKDERASAMGKIGAIHGAGFIIGPAIGGTLSLYGFSASGYAAAFLTLINLIFVLFFLPESLKQKESNIQKSLISKNSFLRDSLKVFSKPLIGTVLIIFFIVFFSFSTVPVTVPLLALEFFGFGPVEMSYFFIYIGIIQIIFQGLFIGRLTKKIGERTLIVFGPLLMMVGIFFMPLFSNIILFLLFLTVIAFSSGMMRTIVPSFVSKISSASQQGIVLGVTNSVLSVASVPGPLIGGFLFEFVGLRSPFFASAIILFFAFGIGFKVLKSPQEI